MTQTWSQASYLVDNYILLKKIRFRTFGKQGTSGPSSVFIMIAPIVAAMFLKEDVCCGW